MTDTATLEALLKRAEALSGKRRIPDLQSDLFPEQKALVQDPFKKKVALCSRRSGKTVAAAYALAMALEESGLDDTVLYLCRTRAIAKLLMWQKLKSIARKWKLAWTFREVDLQVVSESGGMIQLAGLDKAAEQDKLRGIRARLAVLDEPGTYDRLIGSLITQVIEPALGDLSGSLLVVGTPGISCQGWWHDVSTGVHPGFSRHHWTIVDNPHFPNPEAYLRRRRAENGWDENHPIFLREDRGEWVQDDSDLVFKFLRDRNVCTELPHLNQYTIAADFGVLDACAWVVLGWKLGQPECFVVEAHKHEGMLPDEAAAFTKNLVDRFKPIRLVGDSQGLGKAYVEQFNRRYQTGTTMICSDKGEKRAFIELINGEFRTGRLKVLQGAGNPLLDEIAILGWNAARTDPSGQDHCADALVYAWRMSTAYRDTANSVRQAVDMRDLAAVLEAEDERLAEELVDREWWDDQRFYGGEGF